MQKELDEQERKLKQNQDAEIAALSQVRVVRFMPVWLAVALFTLLIFTSTRKQKLEEATIEEAQTDIKERAKVASEGKQKLSKNQRRKVSLFDRRAGKCHCVNTDGSHPRSQQNREAQEHARLEQAREEAKNMADLKGDEIKAISRHIEPLGLCIKEVCACSLLTVASQTFLDIILGPSFR